MRPRTLAAALTPAVGMYGLAGCAAAASTCTVRHHYAIVIFQNGTGNPGARLITRFRLTIDYGGGNLQHQVITARIALPPAGGANPPLIIKTYHVGAAVSCTVDGVRARQR